MFIPRSLSTRANEFGFLKLIESPFCLARDRACRALEQGLGEHFTDEAREAWTLTYLTLSKVMIEAGHEVAT